MNNDMKYVVYLNGYGEWVPSPILGSFKIYYRTHLVVVDSGQDATTIDVNEDVIWCETMECAQSWARDLNEYGVQH